MSSLVHDDACMFFFYYVPPPASHPLSLHDALPIYGPRPTRSPLWGLCALTAPSTNPAWDWQVSATGAGSPSPPPPRPRRRAGRRPRRSEEHTSELQSRGQLVCRLLLEKKTEGTGGIGRCECG